MLSLPKREAILQARRELLDARARGDAGNEGVWCSFIDRLLDEYLDELRS